jgi:hypothetical protein
MSVRKGLPRWRSGPLLVELLEDRLLLAGGFVAVAPVPPPRAPIPSTATYRESNEAHRAGPAFLPAPPQPDADRREDDRGTDADGGGYEHPTSFLAELAPALALSHSGEGGTAGAPNCQVGGRVVEEGLAPPAAAPPTMVAVVPVPAPPTPHVAPPTAGPAGGAVPDDLAARDKASSSGDPDQAPAAVGESDSSAEPLIALPEPSHPLSGVLPLDLDGLRRSADAFFERLAHFGDDWDGACLSTRLSPWLVAVAAVAGEIAWRSRRPPVLAPEVHLPGDEA